MGFLLEVLKGIFFVLTILVGIFFVRGKDIVGEAYYDNTRQILMPGYLIFCGIMIGYIIARVRIGYDDDLAPEKKDLIHTKSFIIGVSIGLILAIMYIFI